MRVTKWNFITLSQTMLAFKGKGFHTYFMENSFFILRVRILSIVIPTTTFQRMAIPFDTPQFHLYNHPTQGLTFDLNIGPTCCQLVGLWTHVNILPSMNEHNFETMVDTCVIPAIWQFQQISTVICSVTLLTIGQQAM